jgi:S1-C subfamily serine protease
MKKLFSVFIVAVCGLSSVLFSACSLYEVTDRVVYHDTFDLRAGVNLALRSSVIVQTDYGQGSGVIYKIDGDDMYIITNWHVISRDASGTRNSDPTDNATPAGAYRIIPAGVYDIGDTDTGYIAKTNIPKSPDDPDPNNADDVVLVGGSSYYDIAVLKVTNTSLIYDFNLVAVRLFGEYTDDDPEKQFVFGRLAYGDTAFAVGNSLGEGISATEGIVSVPTEYITDTDIMPNKITGGKVSMPRRVIRTTAAVAQGNSGGGLFNGSGELVGIIQSRPFYTGMIIGGDITKDNLPIDNIAYAIPIEVAVRIAGQMVERDNLPKHDPHLQSDPYAAIRITAEKDCLLLPSVGVTLGWNNKRSTVEDGIVYYAEDVFIDTVSVECDLDFAEGDIIRKVICGGKELKITRWFQIREFLIECYATDTVTFFAERNGEADLCEITGGFAGVTNGRA